MLVYLEERHKPESIEVILRKWDTGTPVASYWDVNTPAGRKCARTHALAAAERYESEESHEQD